MVGIYCSARTPGSIISVWIGSILQPNEALGYVRSRGTRLVRAADGGPAGWPCHVVALVLSV